MNVLEVAKLSKQYKDKLAVQNMSFSLQEGKCTALLGPNGAGKTTTLNMITGLIDPSAGKISSPLLKGNMDLRSMIGFLPQFPAFYEWISGEEYLIFAGELCHLSKSEAMKRADELIQLVGLEEGKKRKISQYSGGMKQRLGIAQALIHKPKLILLDEPVSALDPFGRREVLELMKGLKNETTILFSTHILNDAEEVCDDVLFMNQGKLIESGNLTEVKKRHAQNLIRLQFTESANRYAKPLQKDDWTIQVNDQTEMITIHVNDLNRAREEILLKAAQGNWPLLKFEISESTLEEIFLKVVKM